MIGLLLISHGEMAAGMLDSLAMILGEAEQIDSLALNAGEDFASFKAKVIQQSRTLDTGDGVLIFVDLFGASPCNAAQYAKLVLKEEGIALRMITGMNLPMLLETAALRDANALDALAAIAMQSGAEGICEPVMVEEEDGEYA